MWPSRGHWAMSEVILVVITGGKCYWHLARDAANHPAKQTKPHQQGLSSPKHQHCWGWETLRCKMQTSRWGRLNWTRCCSFISFAFSGCPPLLTRRLGRFLPMKGGWPFGVGKRVPLEVPLPRMLFWFPHSVTFSVQVSHQQILLPLMIRHMMEREYKYFPRYLVVWRPCQLISCKFLQRIIVLCVSPRLCSKKIAVSR